MKRKTTREVLKIADKLIDSLQEVDNVDLNCRIVFERHRNFMLCLSANGKKFVVFFNGFNGFNGCILGKYNIAIYDLLYYMVKLDLITDQDGIHTQEYLLHVRELEAKNSEIQKATGLLISHGYSVKFDG